MAWQYKFVDNGADQWATKYGQYITDNGDSPGGSSLQLAPQDEAFYQAILNNLPITIVVAGYSFGLITKDRNPDGVTPAMIRRIVWILRQEFPRAGFTLNTLKSIPMVHVYNKPNDFWDQSRGFVSAVFSTVGNAVVPGGGSLIASSIASNNSGGVSTQAQSNLVSAPLNQSVVNASGPSTTKWIIGGSLLTLVLAFVIGRRAHLGGVSKKVSKKSKK
jgi:hypothetical protein